MESPDSRLAMLLEQAATGDNDAAQRLHDEYSHHLLRVVRRHLPSGLRRQFDSGDFLQSVWGSFFTGPVECLRFNTPKDLVCFLVRMARNKINDACRQSLLALKRDPRREEKKNWAAAEMTCGREPTPSGQVQVDECWERFHRGLTPQEKKMVELLQDGCSQREVARRCSVHPKTVQRLIRRLTEGLNQ